MDDKSLVSELWENYFKYPKFPLTWHYKAPAVALKDPGNTEEHGKFTQHTFLKIHSPPPKIKWTGTVSLDMIILFDYYALMYELKTKYTYWICLWNKNKPGCLGLHPT